MNAHAPELRSHPRYSLDVVVDLESEHTLYAGVAGDVSEGGVFVATHVPPPSGSLVKIRLILPEENVVFEADGIVRWIRSVSASCEGMPPGCGIAWAALSDGAHASLLRFAARRDPILFEP
jgi:hypothetical protein